MNVGEAFVTIRPVFDRMAQTVARSVRSATEPAGRQAEEDLGAAGRRAGMRFGESFADDAGTRLRHATARISNSVGTDASRIGEAMGAGIVRGVLPSLDVTERRLRQLGSSLIKVGIVASLGILAQQAIALAGALAPIGGILAAIPAAAAAASAGIGSFLVGAFGFVDALKKSVKASTASVGGAGKSAVSQQRAIRSATKAVEQANRGVEDAVKDVARAQKDVAEAQEGVERAQRGVAQAIEDVSRAQRGVADAQKDVDRARRAVTKAQEDAIRTEVGVARALRGVAEANEEVADAVRGVEQAQRRARSAEEQLTAARAEATRTLQTYQRLLAGAAADEEEADIARQEAQRKLRSLIRNRISDQLRLRDAQNDVAQAEIRYQEAVEANADLQRKAAQAQAAGVEGDERVVAAREAAVDANQATIDANKRLEDSQRGVIDAQESVAEAQLRVAEANERVVDAQDRVGESAQRVLDAQADVRDAVERVAEAHERVADANDRVIESQDGVVEADRRVVDAREEVIDANERLKEAMEGAAAASGGASAAQTAAAAAMAALSPAARATAQAILDLKDEWNSLRRAVQEELFSGLDQQVTRLATASFPTLERGMTGVANALNQMIKGVAEVMATPMFQGNVATVFAAEREMTLRWAEALGPLTQGLLNLAVAGLPVIQRFNTFITDGLKAAGAFLSTAEGAERMRGVMDRAADALSLVWQTLGNVKDILAGIFDAANADKFLVSLERITGRLAELANSAEGQRDMETVFASFARLAEHMGEVLPTVANAVVAVLNAINGLPGPLRDAAYQSTAWAIALGPIISGLASVSVGIKGAIDVAGGLKRIVLAMSGIATSFVTTAAAAVSSAALTARIWVMYQVETVKAAASMALFRAQMVGHWIAIQVQAMASSARAAGAWALLTGASAAQAVASMARAVASVVAGWVLMGAQALAQAARVAAAWVIAMGPIGIAIAAVVGLVTVIVKNWDTIKEATGTAWSWVSDKIEAVVDLLVDIFTNFTVPGLLLKHWESVKEATRSAWEWVQDRIEGIVDGLVSLIRNFTLPGLLISHWDDIKEATSNAWEAVRGFVVDKIEAAKDRAERAAANVRDFVSGAWDAVRDKTSDAWERVRSAIADRIDDAVDLARGLPGRITGAVGDLGSVLYQKGLDVIQGFLNGAGELLKTVGSFFVSKLPGWIQEPFKKAMGIRSPSKVFAKYGQNLIMGLTEGIERERSGLRNLISDLTNDIASAPDKRAWADVFGNALKNAQIGVAQLRRALLEDPTASSAMTQRLLSQARQQQAVLNGVRARGEQAGITKNYNLTVQSSFVSSADPITWFKRMERLGV